MTSNKDNLRLVERTLQSNGVRRRLNIGIISSISCRLFLCHICTGGGKLLQDEPHLPFPEKTPVGIKFHRSKIKA